MSLSPMLHLSVRGLVTAKLLIDMDIEVRPRHGLIYIAVHL